MSTELLTVPVKKPSEVDVVKPLKNLIQSAYSTGASGGSTTTAPGAAAVDYAAIVSDFGKLRNSAIWKFYEKYEASLEVVYG